MQPYCRSLMGFSSSPARPRLPRAEEGSKGGCGRGQHSVHAQQDGCYPLHQRATHTVTSRSPCSSCVDCIGHLPLAELTLYPIGPTPG